MIRHNTFDMAKIEVFDIELDDEQAVYREGDTVAGYVKLETKEDIKLKAVRLELIGLAVVKWTSEGEKLPIDLDDKVKGNCTKENYFYYKTSFIEKDTKQAESDGSFLEKDPVLQAGSYSWPFQAKLPPELPSSFESTHGQVRYLAKAFIERPWKSNIMTKKAFTVLSGLDLNFIPEAAARIELCKFKELGHACCSSGSLTIDWTVERSGYVPGEDIIIHGAIQNESNDAISNSKVALYMVIEYKCKKRRRKERKQVASVEKGETPPGEVTVWCDALHIPPIPPTGLCRSDIIDVSYELQFLAAFEGKYSPIVFTKDVYIGTVPICRKEMRSCIAGMYNQPYKDSSECLSDPVNDPLKGSQVSLTHLIAAASVSETKASPTAPALTPYDATKNSEEEDETDLLTDQQGSAMERPPPYAPGHAAGFGDGVIIPPAAPPPYSQEAHHTDSTHPPSANLYPTLAASWFGAVSIRDPDDTDSTQGDLTYSPVYTYYCSN